MSGQRLRLRFGRREDPEAGPGPGETHLRSRGIARRPSGCRISPAADIEAIRFQRGRLRNGVAGGLGAGRGRTPHTPTHRCRKHLPAAARNEPDTITR